MSSAAQVCKQHTYTDAFKHLQPQCMKSLLHHLLQYFYTVVQNDASCVNQQKMCVKKMSPEASLCRSEEMLHLGDERLDRVLCLGRSSSGAKMFVIEVMVRFVERFPTISSPSSESGMYKP